MSYSTEKLMALAENFQNLATEPEELEANTVETEIPEDMDAMSSVPDTYIRTATDFEVLADQLLVEAKDKKEKKLDPKAKVRNRGTVCVPASSAKDKKDHFPINDEGQARNALARVHQYSKAPEWYSGSLKGLQDLVSRKVHSKYPSIGKEKKEKKSSVLNILEKYGSAEQIAGLVGNYPSTADFLKDLAKAQFNLAGVDPNTPEDQRGDEYMQAKAMHDAIMGFANEFSNLEADYM